MIKVQISKVVINLIYTCHYILQTLKNLNMWPILVITVFIRYCDYHLVTKICDFFYFDPQFSDTKRAYRLVTIIGLFCLVLRGVTITDKDSMTLEFRFYYKKTGSLQAASPLTGHVILSLEYDFTHFAFGSPVSKESELILTLAWSYLECHFCTHTSFFLCKGRCLAPTISMRRCFQPQLCWTRASGLHWRGACNSNREALPYWTKLRLL